MMGTTNSHMRLCNLTFTLTLRLTSDGWFTLVDRKESPTAVIRWHSSFLIKTELRDLVTRNSNKKLKDPLFAEEVLDYEL